MESLPAACRAEGRLSARERPADGPAPIPEGAVRRIVVTGPESTGKSTLAAALGRALGTAVVPEFARAYAEGLGRPLTAGDVEPIAQGQIAAEDRALRALTLPVAPAAPAPTRRAPWLVLDTDLVSTVVYARYYYGSCPTWIEEAARSRLADLYLLAAPDIPWAPDPVRDVPEARAILHDRFRAMLAAWGARTREVSGTPSDRLSQALQALRGLTPDA